MVKTTQTGSYVRVRRYGWVDYPTEAPEPITLPLTPGAADDDEPETLEPFPWNPDYIGFRMEYLENPTYGQLHDERMALGKLEEEYFRAIAPRVRAWNAQDENADGTVVNVPAPGETDDDGAHRAFYAIERDLVRWVLYVMQTGHRTKSGTN